MSYEEARKDRARNRKDRKIGLILGALAGVGQSLQAMQRQRKADEIAQQTTALRERQLDMQERGLEQEMELAGARNQTQLDVARINASGRGEDRRISQWEAESEGIMEAYPEAGGDPTKALQSVRAARDKRTADNPLANTNDLDSNLKMLLALSGKRKLTSGGGAPMQPQPTGDMAANESMPRQAALSGQAPWAGGLPQPGANVPPGGWAGSMNTAPQSMHAAIAYERLADAYRRFQSSNGRDMQALDELNQLYGGTLPTPRSAAVQLPQKHQRTTTGMGTTTVPR